MDSRDIGVIVLTVCARCQASRGIKAIAWMFVSHVWTTSGQSPCRYISAAPPVACCPLQGSYAALSEHAPWHLVGAHRKGMSLPLDERQMRIQHHIANIAINLAEQGRMVVVVHIGNHRHVRPPLTSIQWATECELDK